MPLPDPASSRAVLIGVGAYESLPVLPAATNNIEELASLLTDRDLWGLPEENCHIVRNPRSATEVLDIVHEAVGRAEDALLLYFAGHGLVSLRDELFLALPGTSADRLYRALPFADLRSVLLDCCYSGRAMDGYMGEPGSMIERARVDGSYLMTASSETARSWAYKGERFTAFTGELIKTLRSGIPGGPDLLEMESIYWHVRGLLEEKGRAVPQQRMRNDGRKIALVRNRHSPAVVARTAEGAPAPPAGRGNAPRGTGQELTAYVIGLYEDRLDAETEELMARLGAGPAEDVVQAFLAMKGHPALRTTLLSHAFDHCGAREGAELLVRMRTVPGGEEALSVLTRTYRESERAQRVLEMTDHLLAGGLTEHAYPLYTMLPTEIRQSRTPEQIAVLLKGMGDTGREQKALQLLERLFSLESAVHGKLHLALAVYTAGVSGAGHIGRLAVAGVANDELRDVARQLRASYADALPTVAEWACGRGGVDEVIFFVKALHENDRPRDASKLLGGELRRRYGDKAAHAELLMRTRSAEFLDAVGVENLLPSLAEHESAEGLAPLVRHLWMTGRRAEADVLLDFAADNEARGPSGYASWEGDPWVLRTVLAEINETPEGGKLLADEIPAAMPRLTDVTLRALVQIARAEESRDSAHARWISDGVGDEISKGISDGLVRMLAPHRLAALLRGLRGRDPLEGRGWLLDLLLSSPLDMAPLLAALGRPDDDAWMSGKLIDRASRFRPEQTLALYRWLHPLHPGLAENVVEEFVRQGRWEQLRDDTGVPVLDILLALRELRRRLKGGATPSWEEAAPQVRLHGWWEMYGDRTDVLLASAVRLTGRDMALLIDVVPAEDAPALPALVLAQQPLHAWLPDWLYVLRLMPSREKHLTALLTGVAHFASAADVVAVLQELREGYWTSEADALVAGFCQARGLRERMRLLRMLPRGDGPTANVIRPYS